MLPFSYLKRNHYAYCLPEIDLKKKMRNVVTEKFEIVYPKKKKPVIFKNLEKVYISIKQE